MQKWRLPSFFRTNTITLHHTLWLGQIMPESNISQKCVWTSSTNSSWICLNHSLNGMSPVTLITCLLERVLPSLLGSREKMPCYSAKRDWVELASLGGQDSNPLRSNFLNSFSCLCSVVSFCGLIPWTPSNASFIPGPICGSGIQLAATALATRTFFFKVWGNTILFLITTVTLLLPLHISV